MRRAALTLAAALYACASSAPPSSSTVVVTSTSTARSTPDAAVESDATADSAEVGAAAVRLYREAMSAVARNDFPEAARLFGAAYAEAPSLELAFNAFRMHERSAAVGEAESWRAQVLTHDPSAAVRADIDQRMAALHDFARRRQEDIARPPPGEDALVREAVEFFARGVRLYQRRQYRPALEAFEAALRYSTESHREVAELYFNLAVTYEHLARRPEAAAAFREYLARRPDTPDRPAVEQRIRALEQP